jgi:ribosomal protein L40E
MHPYKDDPNAPLFPAVYDGKVNPISGKRVDTMLRQLRAKAEIRKDVSPHKIRHARLTHLAKLGLIEMELRIFAGWEDDSHMPAVYVHMAGGDVEKKLLKLAGIEIDEDENEIKSLEPKVCPRCERKNPFDARFCNCGQILDPKTALEVDEVKEVLRKKLPVKDRLLTKLESFERMQADMKEYKKKIDALEQEVALLRQKN